MLKIDGGRFGHEAHSLLAILLDMLLGAWIDEVDLQVGKQRIPVGFFTQSNLATDFAAVGQVPVVDIIGTEVPECPKASGNSLEILGGAWKRSTLKDQKGGLRVDGAIERSSAASLVCMDERNIE